MKLSTKFININAKLAWFFVGSCLLLTVFLISPQAVHAAPCSEGSGGIGGKIGSDIFVPWYKYLDCDSNTGAPQVKDWDKAAPLVVIAIIELITRISGIVAVGFVVWGGIQYTVSQGEPDGINNAKSTILNAIIGLVIVILSTAITSFVAGLLQ